MSSQPLLPRCTVCGSDEPYHPIGSIRCERFRLIREGERLIAAQPWPLRWWARVWLAWWAR